VVSAPESYGRNIGFLDQGFYFSLQVALNFTLEAEWISFLDAIFLGNFGNAGNRTRTSGSVARKSHH
jgi:hypothetical protein